MRSAPTGLCWSGGEDLTSLYMSQYLKIHPENPQPRLIRQAVDVIRNDGLIVYPTHLHSGGINLMTNRSNLSFKNLGDDENSGHLQGLRVLIVFKALPPWRYELPIEPPRALDGMNLRRHDVHACHLGAQSSSALKATVIFAQRKEC